MPVMTCTVGDERGRRTRTNPTFYVLCRQSDSVKLCCPLVVLYRRTPSHPQPPNTPQCLSRLQDTFQRQLVCLYVDI